MKTILTTLVVMLGLSAHLGAQCYSDTGKHSCFEYSNLRNESDLSPFPFRYTEDFAAFYVNPNSGQVWIRGTLVADDPNYVYTSNCVNKNGVGQCVGTYQFADRRLEGYPDANGQTGYGVQARDAFPGCYVGHLWEGGLRVESVAKGGVSIKNFYNFSPSDFGTGRYLGLGSCFDVYRASWQSTSLNIPVVWDSDIERLVAPYSNTWHNTISYPYGWKTELQITHTGSQATTFTVETQLPTQFHGHSGTPCIFANEGVIQDSVSISPGQTKTVNVYDFHVPTSARVAHDGVLFVRLNPLVGGLWPTLTLTPRTSGFSICSGVGEP